MSEWIKGLVVDTVHWTENLFSLLIDAPLQNFTAGQYTSLGLDIAGERSTQPYSLLSSPGQRPLEFFLYTNLDGELSTELTHLRQGDAIWVRSEAAGIFTLDQVSPADDLWLLATGTGVAPFLSMLLTDSPWTKFKHVVLVYAARTRGDLCYLDRIEQVRRDRPQQFSFIPFVSREISPGSLHGRIPDSIKTGKLDDFAERKLHTGKSQIMLCGNPGMVMDATRELQARGFTENRNGHRGQITYESYW